ncbi:MAG TPA: hypothetical protein VFP34_08280 [Microlunatus sp.]|nr:hypothetical protein [Microlunatus sp.]
MRTARAADNPAADYVTTPIPLAAVAVAPGGTTVEGTAHFLTVRAQLSAR